MTIDLSLPWQVIEGDYLDVMRALPDGCVDAVVTDPPYGIGHVAIKERKTDKSGLNWSGNAHYGRWSGSIFGDDGPFDPAPLLRWPCVLWGANYYHARLPDSGGWLVWDKKDGTFEGWHSADADLAWCSTSAAPRIFRLVWMGLVRGENTKQRGGHNAPSNHPNEKPIGLMRWSIEHLNLAPNALIIDPYCGSGTTGVAAIQEGYRFLGIEREPAYCAIARRRIADAAAQGNLFG